VKATPPRWSASSARQPRRRGTLFSRACRPRRHQRRVVLRGQLLPGAARAEGQLRGGLLARQLLPDLVARRVLAAAQPAHVRRPRARARLRAHPFAAWRPSRARGRGRSARGQAGLVVHGGRHVARTEGGTDCSISRLTKKFFEPDRHMPTPWGHMPTRRRGARRARRVQNMGWTSNNSLWLATRGGDVFFAPQPGVSEKFDQAKLGSRGFGILDVACAPIRAAGCCAVPARGDDQG